MLDSKLDLIIIVNILKPLKIIQKNINLMFFLVYVYFNIHFQTQY